MSRRCGWTSSAAGRCSSSSGTSAASTRCARSRTCRAWHERYADDGLRVIGIHTGGFAPARDPEAVARGRRAARHRVPRRDRRAARAVGLLRQRGLARALPVGHRRRALLDALRRGRLRRDRARDPGAARRRARARAARCGPRTRRASLLPAQTADQPGAYSGPYEAGGVWAVLEGAARCASNGRAIAVDGPGALPAASSTRATRAALLELEIGDGVTCHATCFTPGRGACSSSCPRSPSRRISSRRPVVGDRDRGAGPVGRRVRLAGEEVRLVDPAAGVEQPRAGRRRPLRRGRRAATGRSGGSGRTAPTAR